jgi:peptidoglycan/xylan/chitin deacetylase (PgdA/CDA1 family)
MMQSMLQPLVKGVLRRAARHTRSKPFAMRNAAPLVSFTFDDVPDSAYTNGAAVLDACGLRGTFYVASGTCGSTDRYWRVIGEDQVRALYDSGHEIGCHTFSHVRVEDLDARSAEEECGQNLRRLRELCPGIALANFCYPFGRASLPRKAQLQKRFDSCRGVYQGINAGIADLGMLRVIELYDRTLTPDKLRRVLRQTRERNGWLIFATHDVAETPSWIGCSPRLLRETVTAVLAENMQCLSVRDALAAIGYTRAN